MEGGCVLKAVYTCKLSYNAWFLPYPKANRMVHLGIKAFLFVLVMKASIFIPSWNSRHCSLPSRLLTINLHSVCETWSGLRPSHRLPGFCEVNSFLPATESAHLPWLPTVWFHWDQLEMDLWLTDCDHPNRPFTICIQASSVIPYGWVDTIPHPPSLYIFSLIKVIGHD